MAVSEVIPQCLFIKYEKAVNLVDFFFCRRVVIFMQ